VDNQSAVNIRFGWYENGSYENFYDDLTEETYYKGAHSPNYEYVESFWYSDGRKVSFVWGLYKNELIGFLKADKEIRFAIETLPAWPGFEMSYTLAGNKLICSSSEKKISLRFLQSPEFVVEAKDKDELVELLRNNPSSGKLSNSTNGALVFDLENEKPLYFSSGNYTEVQIDSFLNEAKESYQNKRLTSSGMWGDFASPILNNIQHSRAYNYKNKLLTTVVAHKWSKYGGQRIFEWDTFFNGLLASLEDTLTAKEDFRGMLNYQQANGMVPNVASPIGEISIDRSQPPVGAMCVWKYYLHTGDKAFLEELFPKLYDWNRWWFKINEETGLPYRDGNKNGLLEWGTSNVSELDLGKLQLAKFESGQDNSPMFDDVIFNTESNTMEIDMVGLSSLWAADALYLSKIAEVIGENEKKAELIRDSKTIVEKIEQNLWDPEQKRYTDRYWDGKSKKPHFETARSINEAWLSNDRTGQGLIRKLYQGDDLVNTEMVRDFSYIPDNGVTKIEWSGYISIDEPDQYFFYSPDENGVLLYLDSQKLFDNRRMFITEYTSQAAFLEKGRKYHIRLIYDGKEPFELKYSRTSWNENKNTFSNTFSVNAFYPLITDQIDQERANIMLDHLTDTELFWGEYVIPTVSRQDPAFVKQGYWRGRIWPPTNYLVFQGILNYADHDLSTEYAQKSVNLFMRSWNENYECYENWYANGKGSGFPHYTWGALNLLIGLENFIRLEEDEIFMKELAEKEKVKILNYPVLGLKRNFTYD
jgi:glycogen debranching enzyme